jgi:hypothetical protein
MRRVIAAVAATTIVLAGVASAKPWPRAYVIDDRLAVLRTSPRFGAPIAKRLRPGRMVAILQRTQDQNGLEWVRVAVTRRTRGWILRLAIAVPGRTEDEQRLAGRLSLTSGFERLRIARVALDHFREVQTLAASAFDAEAAAAAEALSSRLAARDDIQPDTPPAVARALLLSDPTLDRYVRLGVVFDVDVRSRVVTARPIIR